ncbi:hypothetical protein DSO57_1025778 [Entomophthora muscae]|uniref:Uncharacterized protein n=1 Tax=Entomophthora muscae TaxID=34485 RepID=A0ACC2TQJ0_9FUNG|nr:hypothetical protein DSO57_1025778 [Entomophthora muscae]
MGKSNSDRRGGSNRPKPFNPVGLISMKDLESMEDPLLKPLALAAASAKPRNKNEVAPLIKKLGDTDAGNRAWAASAVSILATNDPITRKHLLASNVLGLLIALLNDPVREVMIEALGTLRNLSALDDTGIITEIFNKKIMVPLHKLMNTCSEVISKIIQGVTPQTDSEKEDYRVCFQVAENVICLLWSLGETSPKFLTQVTQDIEMTFIISCLISAQHLPQSLVITAARCLLTLTENNKDLLKYFFAANVNNVRAVEALLNDQTSPMLRALAVGILSNLHVITSPAVERTMVNNGGEDLLLLSPSFYSTLLPLAAGGLLSSAEIGASVDRALAEAPQQQDEANATTRADLQNIENKTSILQATEVLLSDQHVVLEILANLTSEDQNEANAQEEPQEEPEEEMDDEDDDVEIPDDIEFGEPEAVDVEVKPHVAFTLDVLIPKLRELAGPHPLVIGQPDQPSQPHHADLASGLAGLHHRALGVLNNLLAGLAVSMPASQRESYAQKYCDGISDLWNFLFSQVSVFTHLPSEDHQEVVSQALSCLWALARWAGHQALALTDEHLNFLLGLASSSNGAASIKAVGVLGFIAQRRPGHVESNKLVGDFLIQIISRLSSPTPPSAELVFAALNAIYDIYDDASHDYDAVFISSDYLQVLEVAITRVNKMLRGIDRRKDADLREHGDDTLVNLKAFVKYKKQERKDATKN